MLTGTLTILCLDFAESAKLLEFMPSVAGKAVRSCNEYAREVARLYDAVIHEELALECSLLMAFELASDCIEAATALHRHLLSEPWHPGTNIVRTGILTGEVKGGEDGADELLASLRSLTDLARPGQILVGESTHAIVCQGSKEEYACLNLGLYHLEGSRRGQTLYQLLHPALPSDFKLLPSLLEAASNLPGSGTPFVGREQEIEDSKEWFYFVKVVSLVGFAGVGKSRLAIEVALRKLEDHYHGACYVDLSLVGSAKQVYQLTATALGVSENPELPLEQAVLDKLRPLEKLILFDNADDVLGELPEVIARIRSLCPHMQVMTTSRKQFEVPNLRRITVQPMETPSAKTTSVADLEKMDSVKLFLNRASLVKEDFDIDEHNASVIASICSQLDGMPLAIELAAARVAHMDVASIAKNLDLYGRTHGRQKKPDLDSAIRWSFDGLTENQRTVVLRLCHFAGEFLFESAVKVAGWAPLTESETKVILDELAALSYLTKTKHGEQTYLKVLDLIREFGRHIVVERGWTIEYMNRHADWFVERARYISENIYREHQTELVEELDRTYPNYSLALAWCCDFEGDPRAQLLVRALYIYWHHRSMYGEGWGWAEDVLGKNLPTDPVIRGKLHIIAGILATAAGGYEPANNHFRKALRLGQKANDLPLKMGAYAGAGSNHGMAGDQRAAIASLEKALDIALQLGDTGNIADFRNNLSGPLVDAGRHEAAKEHLLKALDTYTKGKVIFGIACTNFNLGRSYRLSGNLDQASIHLETAAANYLQAQESRGLAATLRELALLRTQLEVFNSAATLFGAEQHIRDTKKIYIPLNRRAEIDRALGILKLRMGSAFLVERQRGYEMTLAKIREFLLLDKNDLTLY